MGSMNGIGTTVAGRSPFGQETTTELPGFASSTGNQA
jgi:hypothetical protein